MPDFALRWVLDTHIWGDTTVITGLRKILQSALAMLGFSILALGILAGSANAQVAVQGERYVPGIWVDPDGCEHWVMDDGADSINGHTDSRASDEYNMKLSLRRANAVAAIAKSVGARVASVRGYGERQPIAPNNTAAGMQKNRRVEIQCIR